MDTMVNVLMCYKALPDDFVSVKKILATVNHDFPDRLSIDLDEYNKIIYENGMNFKSTIYFMTHDKQPLIAIMEYVSNNMFLYVTVDAFLRDYLHIYNAEVLNANAMLRNVANLLDETRKTLHSAETNAKNHMIAMGIKIDEDETKCE